MNRMEDSARTLRVEDGWLISQRQSGQELPAPRLEDEDGSE